MFSDHLRLYLIGIDVEMLRQMNPETQAVEEGASAQHAIMPRAGAGDVGERIGRISYNQYDRARRGANNFRNYVAIDFCVLVEQPQSALGIAAVGGAAGFLVDAGSDHHKLRLRQVVAVSVDHGGLRTKR